MADYEVKPSRIKLKATAEETASRIYRREQRRFQRQQARISRANGSAASPPLESRTETISPPRHRVPLATEHDDFYDDDFDATVRMGREDWADKLAYLAAEEGVNDGPFAAYDAFEPVVLPRIPARFMPPSLRASGSAYGAARGSRRPAGEVSFAAGPVPPLGGMTERQYADWVWESMESLRSQAEARDREARQQEGRRRAAEAERMRQIEQEQREERREERREARRARRAARERERAQATLGHGVTDEPTATGATAAQRSAASREAWRARWRRLGEDDIVALDLAWSDIPWPAYERARGPDDLTRHALRDFLRALADDDVRAGAEAEVERAYKKVLREAIRLYHPDRFFSRVLPRVRPDAHDLVKEGVERCSRLINDLAAE